MQPQYKDYNEIIVTIYFDDGYVVSNIHKTYGKNDNSHLQSLSIEVPSADTDKSSSTGYKGSMSIIDYKNILFTNFVTYQTKNKGKSVQIPIEIQLKCFTGNKLFIGVIDSWKLSFSGGPPSIELQWKAFPSFPTTTDFNGTYVNPSGYIDAMIGLLKGDLGSIKCVYRDPDGNDHNSSEFDDIFEFLYPKDIGYVVFGSSNDTEKNGTIYSALKFFITNVKVKSAKDSVGLTYNYEKSTFIISQYDPSKNVPEKKEDDTIKKLAFVLNGSKVAYSQAKEYDNRCVIPMTSFSYNVDNTNAVLQFSLNQNANGSSVGKDGQGSQVSNASEQSMSASLKRSLNGGDSAGNIEISFECYNVIAFSNNDTGAKIYFRLFTEFGEEHPITANGDTFATVKSINYDLSGAVIKANVTATQVFNTEKDKSEPQEKTSNIKTGEDNPDEGQQDQA